MQKETKQDIKKMLESKDVKKRFITSSLASEILHDYKRDNQILKVLLLVSIIANVLIVVLK